MRSRPCTNPRTARPTPGTDARRRWSLVALLLGGVMTLAGCGGREPTLTDRDGPPSSHPDLSHVRDAVPRPEPKSRWGNPSSYEVFGRRYHVMDSSQGHVERGIASWYGTKFHGRRTSSGEPYDMYAMTAAHKHLPLPTFARVTHLENGRSIVVRINDRGPFHDNRVIDLSYAAAYKLGMLAKGTAPVEVRTIDPGDPTPPTRLASAAPTPPSGAVIYLQAGAFASAQNAQRLREKLTRSLGEPVRVQPAGAGRAVYRVQVGPLPSTEQLDAVAARLADLGIRDTHVVID